MKHLISIVCAFVIVGLLIVVVLDRQTAPRAGSVSVSNEYTATTTAVSTTYGAGVTGSKLIKSGAGALGSVVITGADTGIVNFYNATTTNVNKRTGQTPTSTILLASLPASLVAGTYTFDVNFTAGLYADVVSGNIPTSTVTYR